MNIKYVTVKLPEDIIKEFVDPLVGKRGYSSRTEVIKDALRQHAHKEA